MRTSVSPIQVLSYAARQPVLELVPDLTSKDAEDRDRYEAQIHNHLKSFLECALALKHLHDRRLYRTEYPSFEAYVTQKLGLGRNYALRLVKAADIVENALKPLGDIPLPENESQVRPLTILSREDAQKAWKEVIKKARQTRITTSLVVEVVDRLHSRGKPRKETTALQKEINHLLACISDSVGSGDFETAARNLAAVQVRIDVELDKANRSKEEATLK